MEVLGKILGGIFIVIIVGLFTALPVMYLWDWLMPIIFGLGEITFWQALGINLLCGILFKGNSSSS